MPPSLLLAAFSQRLLRAGKGSRIGRGLFIGISQGIGRLFFASQIVERLRK